MFPNKNWNLGGLKALIKKLTTQVLCGQCEVISIHSAINAENFLCKLVNLTRSYKRK